MIVPYKNISLNVDTKNFDPNKPTILFIHGFTGSSSDWENIVPQIDSSFSSISLDLIGHGKSSSPTDSSFYEIESITSQLNYILGELKLEKVVIAGYSLGGRVALNFAKQHKDKIIGLILESTTAGIENETARQQRSQADLKLADELVRNGMDWFAEYWVNLPIFSTIKNLPQKQQLGILQKKKENNATGLANSLKGFSTGKMTPLWNELTELHFPVLLIVGELDSKYIQLNTKMNELLPHSLFEMVKAAGHNIHLEKPSEFIILVNRFLRTFTT